MICNINIIYINVKYVDTVGVTAHNYKNYSHLKYGLSFIYKCYGNKKKLY